MNWKHNPAKNSVSILDYNADCKIFTCLVAGYILKTLIKSYFVPKFYVKVAVKGEINIIKQTQ